MGLFDDVGCVGVARAFKPSCGISCHQCDHCQSPKLARIASVGGGVLFLATEPTVAQDKTGEVFTGTYKSLLELADKYDYPVEKISFCFANACRGTGITESKNDAYMLHLESCHDVLMENIKKASPSIIVPLGLMSWDALKMKAFTGRLEGLNYRDDLAFTIIPDQDMKVWLAPSLSPVFISQLLADRQKSDDGAYYFREFNKQMKSVFTGDWGSFPDYSKEAKRVIKCYTEAEAIKALKHILRLSPKYLAFDYETEGIKLEREDMDIICVGLACDDVVYSMDWYKDSSEFVSLFTGIMTDKSIGKIAHHAKYESRVTMNKLGVLPTPWAWDSMYGARVLSNKRKCGLKPQTYINFGIAGYDSIEWYLQTPIDDDEIDKWGNNHRNSLKKYYKGQVREDALFYVGQDALYTLLLAEKQMEIIGADSHLSKGEKLFRSLINPLVSAEVHGMAIDKDRIASSMADCTKIIEEAEKSIYSDDFLNRVWNDDIEGHPFDYAKSSDLGHLIYDLGNQPKLYSPKGSYLLDADTLEHCPLAITDKVLEARKYNKIKTTYLENMNREAVYDSKSGDYILHSNYNLHMADTYRSSSTGGVNLQNIPTRDKTANNIIRSCFLPPKGMMITGADYKALEVSVGDSIHHDKNMLDFLEHDGDMHRASLLDIFMLTNEEADSMDKGLYKTMRQSAKTFNFSSFYGGAAKSAAATQWKNASRHPEVMAHLAHKGIRDYDQFLEHIRQVHWNLWNKQFPEYGQWREDVYKFYQKHGYVELVTGFRCYGPMSKMCATNSPIQGPAAHILLWALSRVDMELRRRHMQSYICNEIHDAMYIATNYDELEEVKSLMHTWMVEETKNKFPWISAPLAIDAEATALREEGGNWASTPNEFGYI